MKYIKFTDADGSVTCINSDHIAMIQPSMEWREDYVVYTIHLDCTVDSMKPTEPNAVLFLRGDPDLMNKLTAGEC